MDQSFLQIPTSEAFPLGHPKPETPKLALFFPDDRLEAFAAISPVCVHPKAVLSEDGKGETPVPSLRETEGNSPQNQLLAHC